MKRILIGTVVLAAIVILGIMAFQIPDQPTDILLSPNGRYRVELYGDKTARRFPIGENTIAAEIFLQNRKIGKPTIHYADFMDTSFERTYQRFRWDGANVIGFHGVADHEAAAKSNGDSLTISNKSSKKINFLNITFGVNRFLVLELEPNTSQDVYINHSMAIEWIAGDGEFHDGTIVAWKGLNFYEKAKRKNERLFRYCMTVNEIELAINSIDLEGENSNPSRIIPRVAVCGD